MKRNVLLIILLVLSNYMFSQDIQHEPERQFVRHLNSNNKIHRYIKEHKIKKIEFYRDQVLSSSLEFNQNGNTTKETKTENKSIGETYNKYNKHNKLIETKHFTPEGMFNYGSYYIYKKDTTFIYNIKDSLLSVKNISLEKGSKSLSTVYNGTEIIRKTLWKIENPYRKPIESWSNNGLYKTNDHIYEKVDNSVYITNIEYDSLGIEVARSKSLLKKHIPSKNSVEYYYFGDNTPSSIEFFDDKKNRIKVIEYNYKGKEKNQQLFKYHKNNLVKFNQKVNSQNNQISTYKYKFDKNGFLKRVIKKANNKKEIFNYIFKFYE